MTYFGAPVPGAVIDLSSDTALCAVGTGVGRKYVYLRVKILLRPAGLYLLGSNNKYIKREI